jgi:hypothetical protein
MDAKVQKLCRDAAMAVAGKHNPPEPKPADPGLVAAIVKALENPPPERPEQIQEKRESVWRREVQRLNEAEELLEVIREGFEAPEDMRSLAIHLAVSHLDECRAHLLTLEAPDQAGLQLKVRTFMEREGDMLCDIVRDELQGVFADVERLLAPATL